jgi:hypothetical protein
MTSRKSSTNPEILVQFKGGHRKRSRNSAELPKYQFQYHELAKIWFRPVLCGPTGAVPTLLKLIKFVKPYRQNQNYKSVFFGT